MTDTVAQPAQSNGKIFSIETTKAELTLALSKEGLAYQKLLQDGEDVVFTKDNLNDERVALKNLRKIKTTLGEMENPHTASWKGWNEARKSLVDPVEALIKKKGDEYTRLAKEVADDARKVAEENARVDGIKSSIDIFFLDQSQAIAGAKTSGELVRIEQLIGSHKGNKYKYAEFLPDLIKKADELTPLIKTQKQAIKDLLDLREKELAALKSGDDQAVLDSREAQEAVTQKIDEGKVVVQEKAIQQATGYSGGGYARAVAPAPPKARLTRWKIEIVDEKVAFNKSRNLLDISVNSENGNESIKILKESGVFEGKTEHIVNGIRYYEEKLY